MSPGAWATHMEMAERFSYLLAHVSFNATLFTCIYTILAKIIKNFVTSKNEGSCDWN
jgi:hypothetical protein